MPRFSYDPFDPVVMADPRPYYRVLRDDYPVYYIDKWDTFALSRFADIWQVLESNDGTFVASEGTLPAATVLAEHNDGPVADPSAAPHAVSRQLRHADLRRCAAVYLGAVPAQGGREIGRANSRAGQRAPRRITSARDVRSDPGVRRHRRGLGGVRIAGFAGRSRPRRAGHRQCRQPGPAGKRRGGGQRPTRLSRVFGAHRAAPPGRSGRRHIADRGQPHRLPTAGRFRAQRHRSRRPDAWRVHRRDRDGAEDRRARIVGAEQPTQSRWRLYVPISRPMSRSRATR